MTLSQSAQRSEGPPFNYVPQNNERTEQVDSDEGKLVAEAHRSDRDEEQEHQEEFNLQSPT